MQRTEPQILQEMAAAITQAEGAAAQIIHQHQDPRWMIIRQALSLTKEGIVHAATFNATKTTITKV